MGYHNCRIKNIFLPGIEPATFMPTDSPIIPLSYSSSMKLRRNPKSFRSKVLHRRQEKYFVFSCFGEKPSSEPCIRIFFHSALADTVINIFHECATTIGELKIFSCPELNPRYIRKIYEQNIQIQTEHYISIYNI